MKNKFELSFVGSASVSAYRIPRHRRMHTTLELATMTARKVRAEMTRNGLPTACHQAIVYGPECGDGVPV